MQSKEIHQPETIENQQNTEESNLIAETEIEAPILRPIGTPSLLPCQRQNMLISNRNDEHCPVKRRLTIGQKHISYETLQVGRDLIHDEKDDPQQHILEEVVCRVSDSEIHVEKDDPQQQNLEEEVCIVSDAEVAINEQRHKVSRAEFCRAKKFISLKR